MKFLIELVLHLHTTVMYFALTAVMIFCRMAGLNIKELSEGPNQLFVVLLHCSENKLSSASWNKQRAGM